MQRIGSSMRACSQLAASLTALLVLGLAPATARAQICGDFEDLADDLYGVWLDRYEDLIPTDDEDLCNDLARRFEAACLKTVQDAVRCWQRQAGAIFRASRSPCKTAANPGACKDEFEDERATDEELIETDSELARQECDSQAENFFDNCFVQ